MVVGMRRSLAFVAIFDRSRGECRKRRGSRIRCSSIKVLVSFNHAYIKEWEQLTGPCRKELQDQKEEEADLLELESPFFQSPRDSLVRRNVRC